tara:strand:- start:600 stop:1205 length:606 start_codon:yes stop_codon:yes gene_type:complete
MAKFINYKNLEMSNIIYKEPINKISTIFNNNKTNVEPLLIYTPVLRVKKIVNNKLTLDLTNNTEFYDFLRRIDELNISNSYFNSKNWFKKDISLSTIEDYYDSPINNNKNEVQLSIPINSNKELQLDYILDENKKYTNIHAIKDDILVKLNIKYVGIKFQLKSFRPKIEIKSIKICNSIKKSSNLYSDSSEDDFTDEDEFF